MALSVAAAEADLIPDEQVSRWAEIALAEAKKRDYTLSGPDTYVSSYKLLEGLATRFPLRLLNDLLAKIDLVLRRPQHVGRPIDDQVAGILVRLGHASSTAANTFVADRIATAFEQTDDIASDIAPYAKSLSPTLLLVKDRLITILESAPERRIQSMNATMTLVEIGDRSPTLLAAAEGFITRELHRPLAYTANSVARVAWVEEPAVMAKCLDVDRRIALARHCLQRAVDVNDLEANRASYAVAFVNLGPHLPDDERNHVFDRLLPLAGESQKPTNLFDAMEKRFSNPLGNFVITGDQGILRRFTLAALAVLATDRDRQEQVWRAAQRLIVSGERIDSVSVAKVGYTLSQRGFAPNLPWRSMAYSADSEMRQLAAALIPFLPQLDLEAIGDLVNDKVTNVRCDLAVSLRRLAAREDPESALGEAWADLVTRLRRDPSFRVRSELP